MSLSAKYDVRRVPASIGKEFVREHHYSKGIHNGPMTWGMYRRLTDELVGVIAFATPCSENVRASVFGPAFKHHVTELHRLVLLDHVEHNAESWFIARGLQGLKDERPNYWAVVSFADATQGHIGTIYQATNAIYYGASGKATFYRDADGRLRHPRQNGVNITTEAAAQRGWTPEKRDGKHRYCFLLPDSRRHRHQMQELLRLSRVPYPKPEPSVVETAA